MKPYIEEGKVRPLIQMIETRPAQFAQVPTAPEKGIDVTLGLWRGVVAKRGTPEPIVTYLSEAIRESLDDSTFVKTYIQKRVLDIRPGYLDAKDFEAVARKRSEEHPSELQYLMRHSY